jgi:hypothetical protein
MMGCHEQKSRKPYVINFRLRIIEFALRRRRNGYIRTAIDHRPERLYEHVAGDSLASTFDACMAFLHFKMKQVIIRFVCP